MTQTHQPDPYHYAVIARAIDFIDAHRTDQPSLDAVAEACGMSPAHFQRVFSQWAGVSPKRYLQYLTLDHAKQLLAEHHTLLDTSAETGLSGTGRLHDLFLRWEAMSPGDYARKGEGLEIGWDWIDTPFGPALAMVTKRGLCGLGFQGDMTPDAVQADLQSRWPKARFFHAPARVAPVAAALFGATEAGQPVDLHLIGAPFQIKVWEALLAIPSGEVATYSDVARRIGNPNAVRAVGTAIGRNPISWLIPCHRALRKSGGLGGYHWGLPVKRALLAHEAVRRDIAEEHGTLTPVMGV
ncbi:methylated-DNA--[protein]-cysteine S-methyltransferase [Oceanomicrobium pacificus]|uniref:methylated-DNA--[protein]-cysteine S-methyltransferase n=1 Tax=Oceanomicrobium pacificus TaxID=2692916 RepID=A0A6B0TPF9_9RHOB|nr:bifunctional helix-turn-helix domain-containing protein/methylated-DNA--[protein]-cysteine S-methyltransferase [Oceanomicrobium pacificus]MXU66467.1 methylated-DNA--[protein]-cysteine S-methyltransferase [Oceanomicrobium pacificus]